MKTESKTSFGDKNHKLDLVGMRDLLDANWANRDRSMFRSTADRDGLLDPNASSADAGSEVEVDRRDFMKVMGGTMALAGMTACTKQPLEKIVPYVDAPEEIVPGKPLFYATALNLGGFAQGVLAESHMGRPTKVEGNKNHPASLGGTGAHTQASVLDLYDPDRSQKLTKKGVVNSYGQFKKAVVEVLDQLSGVEGEGLRLILGPSSSLTEEAVLADVLTAYPKAKIHRFDAIGMDNSLKGAELAFGKPLQTIPQIGEADVILSLDADFMAPGPDAVRNSRAYADRRRVVDDAKLNRMYVVESTLTQTGGAAEHRKAVKAARVETYARAIAADLGLGGTRPELKTSEDEFVSALVADLKKAGSQALVLAGEQQPAAVHAIAHAINSKLGAIGTTVKLIEPQLLGPANAAEDFATCLADMKAGLVKAAFVLGANPAYAAPGFAKALKAVPFSAHCGLYADETAAQCLWHVPGTHGLESWGDSKAFDGTVSITQPLIAPLYGGKSVLDILSLIAGHDQSGYEEVQAFWKNKEGLKDDEVGFNTFWRTALHDGVVGKAADAVSVSANADVLKEKYVEATAEFGPEVVIRPDASSLDGQFANNDWLQELPRPVSSVTWDNVLTMSAKTANRYKVPVNADGVQSRNRVKPRVPVLSLAVDGGKITGPVLVLPGHPDDTITVTLGGGRKIGRFAKDLGYNATELRSGDVRWVAQGAKIYDERKTMELALTQDHFIIKDDARALVRQATKEQFKKKPKFAGYFDHGLYSKGTKDGEKRQISLYDGEFTRDEVGGSDWEKLYKKGNQWGMVIDLGTCTGCNACITACQAENNIPTVGKTQVMNGREMHWIRVDRYTEQTGDDQNDVRLHPQPLPCMQCENAPCETVCPVGATLHSNDGLNMMVYNRCVGTRYCSNNCPFKVRRYNYLKYVDDKTESLKFQRNPDVTVRLRGVMEKCTYCVQRINLGRIDAKVEKRDIKDGEIQTACQQACPTQAISFGDINDKDSRVAKLKKSGLNYTLLKNLNVRPRTSYLAKVRNPNKTLEPNPKPLPEVHHYGEDHGAGHGKGHDDHHGDDHAEPAHH